MKSLPGIGMRLILTLLAGAASAQTDVPEAFLTLESPRGFEVSLPRDWGARVVNGSTLVLSPVVDTLEGPQATCTILHLKEAMPASEVAGALARSYNKILHRPEIRICAQDGNEPETHCTLTGTFFFRCRKFRLHTEVTLHGRGAAVTEFLALETDFDRVQPDLMRAVASLRLDASLRDPDRVAPASGAWKVWKDPKEKAFSVRIPRDWKARGGTVRASNGSFCRTLEAEREGRPYEFIRIFQNIRRIYMEPNEFQESMGIPDGTPYGKAFIMRYKGARHYLEHHALTLMGDACKDMRLLRIRPRPDLTRTLYSSSDYKITQESVEADLAFRLKETQVKCRLLLIITRSMFTSGAGGVWQVAALAAGAPIDQFDRILDIYHQVMNAFAYDAKWTANESRRLVVDRERVFPGGCRNMREWMERLLESRPFTLEAIFADVAGALECTVMDWDRAVQRAFPRRGEPDAGKGQVIVRPGLLRQGVPLLDLPEQPGLHEGPVHPFQAIFAVCTLPHLLQEPHGFGLVAHFARVIWRDDHLDLDD